MNHHYPDNFGYGRGTPSIPGMGFSGSGYSDPSAMTRMGQPREGYQMSHYPVIQPQSGMYGQGGYMGQQSNHYNMSNYNYGMQGINQASMMGSSRQGDMTRIGPANVINPYYNTVIPPDPHASPHHGSMNNQAINYSHSQANPHMQQPHMSMVSAKNSAIISNQGNIGPIPTQNSGSSSMANQSMHSQGAHSPGHMMSQVGALQNSGTYGNQTSPHMIPRTHHVPQHPMRHPTTQQNPQEVADNILQMASAYPSNQTVQVPLKSRPAPYHIPRSPHYSMSHSDLPHTSPNPHQQQQSPVNCQTSPSPSSSVKSPAPVLAPIPNPIPSPGISGLRSPCNQGMSPCGTQRSPGRMGSSYSGHSQSGPSSHCGGETSPYHHNVTSSDTHYSPCAMTPTHNYAAYSASPSAQRNTSMYSPSTDHSLISTPEQFHHSNYTVSSSSITSSNNVTSYSNSSKKCNSGMSNPTVTNAQMVNSPLMSLQKLVMLPETQVVDPKSVVNDACLSSHEEAPKNADSPAERLVESSSHSVGSQCNSSSYLNQSDNNSHEFHLSENPSDVTADKLVPEKLSVHKTSTNYHSNELVQFSPNLKSDEVMLNADENLQHTVNIGPDKKLNDEPVITFDHNETPEQNCSQLHHMISDPETKNSSSPSPFSAVDRNRLSSDKIENMADKTQAMKTNGHHIPSKPLTILTNSETKKIFLDGVDKSSIAVDRAIHSPDRKNGKIKDEVKRMMIQCRSPGVLSEVPIITNGLINGRVHEKDDEIDQDCDITVHAKLHKGFSSLVKVKLASSKRASQLAHVTPCSIAVGADERAACDRFVYRRNGICRSLRTARIIFNGRNRNDSTGNADSDESLENVSESNFGISGSPQDGNKKRSNTPKRSECKKPDLHSVSTSNKVNESDSKSAEPVTSGSNGCMSYNNNEISDDDVCYYEGVDSSDIFVNNCSSDESLTSSGEFKINKLLTHFKSGDDNQQMGTSPNLKHPKQEDSEEKIEIQLSQESVSTVTECVSPPPSKRLRRSSGQKAKEKLKALSVIRSSNNSDNNKVENNDKIPLALHSKSSRIKRELEVNLVEEVAIEQIVKSSQLRSAVKTPVKYPIVVLEKSNICKNPAIKEEKYDLIDLADAFNDNKAAGFENQQAYNQNESKIKEESHESVSANSIKRNTEELGVDHVAPEKPIPQTSNRKPRKRPHRMKSMKKKDKLYGRGKRNDEVKDSFKSMKFNRTLDLMKARRRRETSSLGPFIRVTGKHNAPDTVSVFNQSVPDSAIATANNKHSKSKKLHSLPNVTTVHMVTNLPTDKTAMISSNRTISQDPWVCAFCSHHSSYRFLGDLFGPYFKESEINQVESIALEESKKIDMSKELRTPDFNTIKKKASELNLLEKMNSGNSKKRGKLALTLKPPEQNLTPPEEVWIHEACALWSPGVCMVGNKMYGLDEAVKDAHETLCSVCKSKGAMIGCLHKGCSMKYHFICAVDKECFMDEENLSLLCPKHKDKKISFAGPSKS